jgi:hypothetical protein
MFFIAFVSFGLEIMDKAKTRNEKSRATLV